MPEYMETVMIEGHQKCLSVLAERTLPNGEMCIPFAPICRDTGYDRRTVKRYVRALARKGLAEYHRGLCTEDEGGFAGAGYCITKAGQKVLEDALVVVGRCKLWLAKVNR